MSDNNISEEKKLLDVIRGDGAVAEDSGDAPAESPRLGLKVLKNSSDVPSLDAVPPVSAFEDEEGGIGISTVPMAKKNKTANSGLSLMNTALLAAMFLMLLFTGLEIWGAVQQVTNEDVSRGISDISAPSDIDDATNDEADIDDLNNYDIEDLKAAFEKRPIINFPGILPVTDNTQKLGVLQVQHADWQKYAKKNLKLLGLSRVGDQVEAVVSDGGRMHYLRIGQELVIEKTTIKVKVVGGSGVELTDGVNSINVN